MANKPLNSIKFPTLSDTYTLDHKANVDGYYEEMTVGDAEQLVSTQYVEDAVPYKFRTSGGSADIGNRAYIDKIVGGSLPWNQLANPLAQEGSGVTRTVDANGVISMSGTATGNFALLTRIDHIANHKYLYIFDVVANPNSLTFTLGMGQGQPWLTNVDSNRTGMYTSVYDSYLSIFDVTGKDLTGIKLRLRVHDLTAMFGSTIADYIYSLEQSTAGAGVQWFKKYFPNDYYPYNAGEMIHVAGLSSHDTVGFNQFNKDTITDNAYVNGIGVVTPNNEFFCSDYIPCFPNTTYYSNADVNGRVSAIRFFDSDKNVIGEANAVNATFITPSNCRYMRANGIKTHITPDTLCINLSWSGTRNGEYEPYQKHSYALDDSLTLRGIPKIDANGNLYYDGDEYESGGTVTRRYGIVTFDGSENWSNVGGNYPFAFQLDTYLPAKTLDILNQKSISNLYLWATVEVPTSNAIRWQVNSYVARIYVYDYNYSSDLVGFKAMLAQKGLTVVYELATPTEETAEPYNNVHIVDDWGTEEFVSTTIVPVGHETRYPQNLRDKTQHLPNLASADGDYAIRQTGSQMALVPLQDVKELPTVPSADGVYYLKVTVSNGTATLSWVAE